MYAHAQRKPFPITQPTVIHFNILFITTCPHVTADSETYRNILDNFSTEPQLDSRSRVLTYPTVESINHSVTKHNKPQHVTHSF